MPHINPPEKLIQHLWFDQMLKRETLCTLDGVQIEVLFPGIWTLGTAGPDFKNAVISFNGQTVTGDVEVHINPEDWENHQHHRDSHYDNVILHAVLRHGAGEKCVMNSLNRKIPQIILEEFLDRPLGEIECLIGNDDPPAPGWPPAKGRCYYELINRAGRNEILGTALRNFGALRQRRKAEKFRKLLITEAPETVINAGIMEALGYTPNRKAFLTLYKTAKADMEKSLDYRDPALTLQALIFGLSSLIPKKYLHFDQKTVEYIQILEKLWHERFACRENERIPEEKWSLGGIRPANFPHRRLAAFSRLLARTWPGDSALKVFYNLFSENSHGNEKSAGRLLGLLYDFFENIGDPYWDYRTNFGSQEFSAPAALIGREKASAIITDCLAPFFTAYSYCKIPGLKPVASALVEKIPARYAVNHVTRFAAQRITGGEFLLPADNALTAQGLIYVFYGFCCHGEKGCMDCYLMSLVRKIN